MNNRASKFALAAPASVDSLVPVVDLAWTQELLRLQAAQWQALLIWQDAMRSLSQEWWEGWICRWTGGVPIDG